MLFWGSWESMVGPRGAADEPLGGVGDWARGAAGLRSRCLGNWGRGRRPRLQALQPPPLHSPLLGLPRPPRDPKCGSRHQTGRRGARGPARTAAARGARRWSGRADAGHRECRGGARRWSGASRGLTKGNNQGCGHVRLTTDKVWARPSHPGPARLTTPALWRAPLPWAAPYDAGHRERRGGARRALSRRARRPRPGCTWRTAIRARSSRRRQRAQIHRGNRRPHGNARGAPRGRRVGGSATRGSDARARARPAVRAARRARGPAPRAAPRLMPGATFWVARWAGQARKRAGRGGLGWGELEAGASARAPSSPGARTAIPSPPRPIPAPSSLERPIRGA
jgi:hypothetical protein